MHHSVLWRDREAVMGETSMQSPRSLGTSPATSAARRGSRGGAPSADRPLDEVESVARIGSYSTDIPAGRWVSSRGLDAIFGIDAAFERSVEGWVSLVHPADREAMVAYLNDEVLGRGRPFDKQYRIVRADTAEERWVHGRGMLELDAPGRPLRMFGTIADITDQRRAQDALIQSELRYAAIFEGTAEAILIAEAATGRFRWVNSAACALLGYARDELLQLAVHDIHPPQDLPMVLDQFQAVAEGRISEARSMPCLRKDGTVLLADIRASQAEVEGVACNIGFFTDVTELRSLQVERERLGAAVEQTSDSVIITDLAGTIEYVNPAFERGSGYRRDEAVGQNPRFLKSGQQSAAFYRALWRRLTRGQTWTGTLIDRRKDGSLYEEEATISPIRGPGGEITGYLAVKRDVTALRAAESGLARALRERTEVAAALARLQPGPSAEETAAEICDELLGLPGIDLVAVINFLDPERAVPLGVSGADGLPLAPGRPLPVARATYLFERAGQGPWAEAWRPRPEDGAYGRAIAAFGIRAVAYAPIRNGDGLFGVVAAGTRDEGYASHLLDHLPAVGEFAATAGVLLSGQLERGHRDDLVRERVRRALAEGGLRAVFQPIVALGSAAAVGYEALTRFADGTPPEQLIADAHALGLGLDLEVACLAAALDASASLSPDSWLSLNASPDVILHSSELAALLAGRSRRIVLEVTEHVEIDDYPGVRLAVAGLGPTVSLAVDDAGAGFASLRHVVELAPRFLKLDVGLVRHVDRDPTRQAMIAGLSHFAARVGCEVIAEGIEERAELEMLRELGVPLGQGYLLGQPEPLPAGGASRVRPDNPRRA
jgi:PAS domain S-box-containing protein